MSPNSQAGGRNSFVMPSGNEMEQIVAVCKVLATCPYYQKLGAGGVLAIYLTAKEMNLPVMMCLNGGMYTFSGAVSLSAQAMNMMIVNAGHRADVLVLDEKVCKIRFWRADRPVDNCTFEYEYTIEMARNAGYLGKDNWKKTPRDMLYSRCLSGGARKFMPDVLMNAYVVGELGEEDGSIPVTMPPLLNGPAVSDGDDDAESTRQEKTMQGGEKISAEQVQTLTAELESCEDVVDQIKVSMKIKSLSEMPHNMFQPALKRIRQIKQERAQHA